MYNPSAERSAGWPGLAFLAVSIRLIRTRAIV